MTKTVEQPRRYVILDSNRRKYRRFLGSTVNQCSTLAEIEKLSEEAAENRTWIAYTRKFTDDLLRAVSRRQQKGARPAVRRHECVLTVASPRTESVPMLHGLFAHIIGDSPGYRWLPKDELSEVLFDPDLDPSELVIATAADSVTQTLSLVRGDCQQLVLPFSFFEPSGDGTRPDFSRVRVTDFGRTVALGDYEAATDAILYEMDSQYRRKVARARKEHDKSFGASLYRLRKQRRLKRSDFRPLASRTIARIERNEIERPHGATLQIIAKRLGVSPDDISEY